MLLIYNDVGISIDSANALLNYFCTQKKCGCEIRFVSALDLQTHDILNQASCLIIPGGRSLPFYEKLGKKGNQNITNFVEQGGTYFGLCAGAYYAAAKTIFAKNLPLELLLPGELNFFQGSAIGPVFAENEFAYHSESGARLVDIIWQDGKTDSVYFNGGCYFEDAEKYPNAVVLARYQENAKPAIIACSVGLGYAILSGVHPELTRRDQVSKIGDR